MSVSTAVFYLIALITVISAGMVAFSRNIIYSAFSLLGTFMGVAGIYVFLGADFVAAVQVLIYVGGILVLILFAVMLTHRITDVEVTNRAAGRISHFDIGNPVRQHDRKQNQHQNAADVDQHLDRRDEISAKKDIDPGDTHERPEQ